MPAAQISKDAREGKGSKESLEKKWKEAKDIVKDEYGDDDNHWGVVQKIYQNKRDASAINATSRLKATQVQAAPPGNLYSKFVKLFGKEDYKKQSKGGGTQRVEWLLGHAYGGRRVTLQLEYYPAHDSYAIAYNGISDSDDVQAIGGKGADEMKVFALFKKQANKWLASGEATPEDREYLEHILTIR